MREPQTAAEVTTELDYYLGLGPYERPAVISWETTPLLGRGTQPADLIPAGIWPTGGAA